MRAHDTYRSERRNAWAFARTLTTIPWRAWNTRFHGSAGYSIPSTAYPPTLVRHRDRSKYMPHIGAKERGRYL